MVDINEKLEMLKSVRKVSYTLNDGTEYVAKKKNSAWCMNVYSKDDKNFEMWFTSMVFNSLDAVIAALVDIEIERMFECVKYLNSMSKTEIKVDIDRNWVEFNVIEKMQGWKL